MLVGSIVLLPKSKLGIIMNDGKLVQTLDPKHEIYSISNVRRSLTSNDIAIIISKIYKVYDIKNIIECSFPTTIEDSFDKNSNSSSGNINDRKQRKRVVDDRNTFIETDNKTTSKMKRKKKDKSISPLSLANMDIVDIICDDDSEIDSVSDLSLNTVVLIDDDLETVSLEGQISDENWHLKTTEHLTKKCTKSTVAQHYFCPSTTVKAGIKPNKNEMPGKSNASTSLKLNNFISDPLFYTLYDKRTTVADTTALSRIRDRSLSSSYIDHEQYSLLPSDKIRTSYHHTCHTQSPPLPPILKELYDNRTYGRRNYHRHHPIQNFTLNKKMSQRKFLKYAKKHNISIDRKITEPLPYKSRYTHDNHTPSRSLSPSRGRTNSSSTPAIASIVNAATPTSHIIQHSQPIYHNSNISNVIYPSPILYGHTQPSMINIRKPYHSTHVTPRTRPQQQILQHNIYHPPPPPLSVHSSSYKYSTNNMRLYSNKNMQTNIHVHGQSSTHYPLFMSNGMGTDAYIDNKRRYSVSSSNQAPILDKNNSNNQLLIHTSPALQNFTSSYSANISPSTYQQQMYPSFEFDRHTLSTNINPQLINNNTIMDIMGGNYHRHKKKYKKKVKNSKYSKTKNQPIPKLINNISYSNTPPISTATKNIDFYQIQNKKRFQISEKNYKNSDCGQRRKSESLSFSAHRKSNTSSQLSSKIKHSSNTRKYDGQRKKRNKKSMKYQKSANVGNAHSRRKNNFRKDYQTNIILCVSGDEVSDHFSSLFTNKKRKSSEKYRKRKKRQHLKMENSKSSIYHQPQKRKCDKRRLSKDRKKKRKRSKKQLQDYIFVDGEDPNTSESAGSRLRANSTPSHSKSNISQSSSESEYNYAAKEVHSKKRSTTDDLLNNTQLKDLQLFDIESEVLNKRRSSNISNSITFFSNESTTASLNLSKSMTNVFSLGTCTSDTEGNDSCSSSPLMYKMIENLEKNVTNHARTFDFGMHFLNERAVEHENQLHLEQKRKSFATVESSPTLSYIQPFIETDTD